MAAVEAQNLFMQTTNDIRTAFLEYFARNGHEIVPSSPLVPRNDPTLLFTNAGMVQFKNVFTGVEKRPYQRATTAQKCVRAGGKHNDLENVGYTARHHTFFEMLGNFSFGDYFKDRAIELAWNLITRDFGLARDRLLVTVYAEDDEAADWWAKIAGLPESRIIRIATSDNFWAMGDTGPCGPCSEIFYDHGEGIPGGPPGSPDAEGDRFVEIWNLVFMQFDQVSPGERVPLPRASVDTGMGLERIAAVLQGKHDNYDIDLFRALILASAEASGVAPDGPHAVSHRVIADHLARLGFSDCRRGIAEQGGARLRAAPDHAARDAPRPYPRLQGPAGLAAGAGAGAADGHRLSRIVAGPGLDLRNIAVRGDQLQADARTRAAPARGRGRAAGARRSAAGRGRLPALRHLRLSARPDRGCIARAGPRGCGRGVRDVRWRRQREEARKSWVGSGEAATEAVWFALREEVGATEFLGYETEDRRRGGAGDHARRRSGLPRRPPATRSR